MATTTTEDLKEKISERLNKAEKDLEEFLLQFSLGKLEARDRFETAKKELNGYLHGIKTVLSPEFREKKLNEVKSKIEHAQMQLSLGKAETKEIFEEQKEIIQAAVRDLKAAVTKRL